MRSPFLIKISPNHRPRSRLVRCDLDKRSGGVIGNAGDSILIPFRFPPNGERSSGWRATSRFGEFDWMPSRIGQGLPPADLAGQRAHYGAIQAFAARIPMVVCLSCE